MMRLAVRLGCAAALLLLSQCAARDAADAAAPARSDADADAVTTLWESSPAGVPKGGEFIRVRHRARYTKRTQFSVVDIGIAWMLLGTIAIVMVLFYLVNWQDDDIRRYSWCIISATIAIFTAVLIFQGVNEFVMACLPVHESMTFLLALNYGLFLLWFALLQLVIAVVSGANCESGFVDLTEKVWTVADSMRSDFGAEVSQRDVQDPVGEKSVALRDGIEVFVQKQRAKRDYRETQMKCWATLLAHMSGFAAINAGGTLQHLELFAGTWTGALFSVLLNQLFLHCLFYCSDKLRRQTEALDGEVDERDELSDEYVEEAENDIASLSVSFLTVQALRFSLSGTLPNREGLEEPERSVSLACILGLYGVGLALGIASVLLIFVFELPVIEKRPLLRRSLEIVQNQGAMAFAWCILWGTHWLAFRTQALEGVGGIHAMAGRIVLALALSFSALAAVWVLDKIEDLVQSRGAVNKRQLGRVINSAFAGIAVLVGFSWEHCFDGGVTAVASLTHNPAVIKLLLAIAVAIVIVPAWRQYILEREMVHRRKFEEDLQAKFVDQRPKGDYQHLTRDWEYRA